MMLKGQLVILQPATPDDARPIYEWLVSSDLTSSMMGPPLFPEVPLPTWAQFCADYAPHFFDGLKPHIAQSFMIVAAGQSIGHINYDGLDATHRQTELDIWLRSFHHCNKGLGSDAIDVLVRYLNDKYSVQEFVLRPSRRNPRAIRSYERAGFVQVDMPMEEQTRIYGKGDYFDDVLLTRRGAGFQVTHTEERGTSS
jgi:RimJ/RimL family protein N-acetyltransferase